MNAADVIEGAYVEAFGAQSGRDLFRADVLAVLRTGCIVSLPGCFCMARPVRTGWPEGWQEDPARACPDPDAWFVHAVCLDGVTLADALRLLPFPLEWVIWTRFRGGKVRRCKLERLTRYESSERTRKPNAGETRPVETSSPTEAGTLLSVGIGGIDENAGVH